MKRHEETRDREILREAFTAGWQAALGRTIRNPAVLAMVDSCFEQWLAEAADEAEVLGFLFRGRPDLPTTVDLPSSLLTERTFGKRPQTGPAEAPVKDQTAHAKHVRREYS